MIRWRAEYRRNSASEEWLALTSRDFTDTGPDGTYISLARAQCDEANARLRWQKFRIHVIGTV